MPFLLFIKEHRERAMPFPYIKLYKLVSTALYSSFSAIGDFFDSLKDIKYPPFDREESKKGRSLGAPRAPQ